MIRRATAEDLGAVERGYEEVMAHEQRHGAYTRWKRGVYPTGATARRALERATLYVLQREGEVCASVILDRRQPVEYGGVAWGCKAGPKQALVIHTLCVRPSKTGAGMGTAMVSYAVELARRMGCKAVRLDTSARNKPAVALYAGLGFDIAARSGILLDGVIEDTDHLFLELCL